MKKKPKKKESNWMALRTVHGNGFPKVAKVYDGDQPLLIEVTEDDSRKGVPLDPNGCPMARAACRNTHSTGAIIGPTVSYIIKKNTAYRYLNTLSLQKEVVVKDRKARFEPGVYQLSPFPPSSKLGAHRSGPSGARGKGEKTDKFRHYTKNIRVLK